MNDKFLVHNYHLEDAEVFQRRDPQLRRLAQCPMVYESPLIDELPLDTPGIYALGGGRQVGKTTLVKQVMLHLISHRKILPQKIHYLTGEVIDDHHDLIREVMNFLEDSRTKEGRDLTYLLVDEVTFVSGWDKAVKYLADAGYLERTFLLITGSDMAVIRDALKQLPGRRGTSDKTDFHYYPLSFKEVTLLRKEVPEDWVLELCDKELKGISEDLLSQYLSGLYDEFRLYHLTGGFLSAINDWAASGRIAGNTLRTYSDWIRGDVLKRNKKEHYLREVLNAVLRRYNTQITWNALARDLSIDHPKTVADYCALLESMDVLFVQSAILEDKLTAAPKKAKKIFFTDPFIHHAVAAYVNDVVDPDTAIMRVFREKGDEALAPFVEASMVTHLRRRYPTYYIKAKGEVDIAYVESNRFWPVEIKWSARIRAGDIKQTARYENSIIGSRTFEMGTVQGVPSYPLPLLLLRFS